MPPTCRVDCRKDSTVSNELRAYNPTWRDRVAAALIGNGKPSRYYRNVISGMVGSTGIGGTGFSLSDPTPAGILFSADEMVRNARDGNYGQAALNAVGALPVNILPAALKVAAKSKPVQRFAAKLSHYYHSLPEVPQRSFEADYPNGATVDGTGRLVYDIEGRPLGARHVSGRQMAGGRDEAEELSEIRSSGEEITGKAIGELPEEYRRQGWLGALSHEGNKPDEILLNPDLTPRQYAQTLPHEVGHAIDLMAGRIPIDGLLDELQPNYSRLNGQIAGGELITPERLGYSPEEAPLEYMAEALLAYQLDPNYAKSLMPRTAARIREYVNSHPELSKIIQFNSLAAAGIGGGSLLAQENAEASEAPSTLFASPLGAAGSAETRKAVPFTPIGASGIPGVGHGIASKGVDNILRALKGEDNAKIPVRIAPSLTGRNSPALDALLARDYNMPTSKIDEVARALLLSAPGRLPRQ